MAPITSAALSWLVLWLRFHHAISRNSRLPIVADILGLHESLRCHRHQSPESAGHDLADKVQAALRAKLATAGSCAASTTSNEPLGGVIIKPGETARASRDAHVGSGNMAILRVYLATEFNNVLAMGPGDPGRLTVPLLPGLTDIDLIMRDGLLMDVPHRPGTRPAN